MTTELDPSTNYLNPGLFEDFIDSIPKLPIYAGSYSSNAAMTPYGFKLLFMCCFFCALRISEALDLQKEDFNLERRILRIRNAKTGRKKGKMKADGTQIVKVTIQETSIPMPLLNELQKNWERLPNTLFSISRQTAWKYAKEIGNVAGLNIYESQEERSITGVWTHLFRKSYSKWMKEKGAARELRMVKLRHKNRDAHDAYDRPDINTLIKWESDIYG